MMEPNYRGGDEAASLACLREVRSALAKGGRRLRAFQLEETLGPAAGGLPATLLWALELGELTCLSDRRGQGYGLPPWS